MQKELKEEIRKEKEQYKNKIERHFTYSLEKVKDIGELELELENFIFQGL